METSLAGRLSVLGGDGRREWRSWTYNTAYVSTPPDISSRFQFFRCSRRRSADRILAMSCYQLETTLSGRCCACRRTKIFLDRHAHSAWFNVTVSVTLIAACRTTTTTSTTTTTTTTRPTYVRPRAWARGHLPPWKCCKVLVHQQLQSNAQ